MWLYFYGVFFILVSNISLLTANNATEIEPKVKAVFADVVKNITRVNNVLEDLIKNYEKLKKIYESEESVQKEESSETEIDELYKKDKADKKISRSKQKSTTTENPSVIATQMFLSAEEFRKENEINIDNSQEKERSPNFSYLKKGKVESSVSDSQNDSYTDESSYSYEDEYSESDITDNENSLIMYRNSDTKQPEKYYNLKRFRANTNDPNKDDLLRNKIIQLTYVNESKPIFKLELSEVFSKNEIQNDFINKNKIKESGNVMIDLKDFLLTRKKMNAINIKNNKTTKLQLKAPNNSRDLSSLEDNKSMEKEQFKTKVLRSAYGEACLQLVVRKCYKACKAAIQSSCKLHKCKSDFKSAFDLHSRRGCINQFTEPELPNNVNNDVLYRNGFSDMTRNGYIAAACLPMTHERTETTNDTEREELNILRDRFERACQKISSEKCNAACAYAVSESCASYPCFLNQDKVFKNSCKSQCKSAYEYRSTADKRKEDDDDDKSDSESSDYDIHVLKKEIGNKKNKKFGSKKIGLNNKHVINNNTKYMVKVVKVTSPKNASKPAHF